MLFVIVCFNFAFSIPHRGPMSVGVRESVTERRFRQVLAGGGPCARGRRGRRRVFERTAVEAGRGFVVRVALGPVSGQAWV